MKRDLLKALGLTLVTFLVFSASAIAQYSGDKMDHSKHTDGSFDIAMWFGLLELPFLIVCVFYSFKTAIALKGGILGKGMNLLAWGFLVMAVGHIAMQISHIFGFDIFRDVLGQLGGNIAWFIALMVTWGLSAYGFYKIYSVSKKG